MTSTGMFTDQATRVRITPRRATKAGGVPLNGASSSRTAAGSAMMAPKDELVIHFVDSRRLETLVSFWVGLGRGLPLRVLQVVDGDLL